MVDQELKVIRISAPLHREVKAEAAYRGVTVKIIVEEAIKRFLPILEQERLAFQHGKEQDNR